MKVNLPEYSIYLNKGEINNLSQHIKSFYYGKRLFIITDENVDQLYRPLLADKLVDYELNWVVVPPGENSKSLECYLSVVKQLQDFGINRFHFILAFGGGVVGDLAGFVATTLLRGIPYMQIPTSLLAMVDSSIGSKVGINTELGKNLLGSFYPPKRIVVDLNFLDTLPNAEYKNGLAEMIKAGIIGDKKLYNCFLDNQNISIDEIVRAIKVKKKLVIIDPKERYERMLLNFGHTFGHAIEKVSNYQIPHGVAVAYGMLMELELGVKHGWSTNFVKELSGILTKVGLINEHLNYIDYLDVIKNDKKNLDDGLRFICVEDIAKCYVRKVDISKL